MFEANTVREFISRSEHFHNDAVIVVDSDGDFSVIPDAYLTDVSYTGPREVVFSGGRDLAAQVRSDYGVQDLDELTEAQWEEIAAMVNEWTN